jgi:hypothetical protein
MLSAQQYRGTWNRLILGGINVLTSYHAFPEWTDAQIREANLYIGRCVEAVSGGRRTAQVAVLYPVETVWARFTPSDVWVEQASPQCKCIEETLREVSEALYRSRREFGYIDTQTALDGTVSGGALTYKEHSWKVIVLPHTDTLPLAAWRKLEAFHEAGGTLILLGATPRNTDRDFPSPDVESLARRLLSGKRSAVLLSAGGAREAVRKIDAVLKADLGVASPDVPLRMTRRSIGGREVWFVINDSPSPWSGSVTLPVDGAVQVCDPASGAIREDLGPAIRLAIPAYGAAALRVRATVADSAR